MRNIFLFVLISGLFNSCSNKTNNEEINYYKINKIKRVEQYSYRFKFGKIDSTSKELYWVNEYDTLGNEVKSIYYFKKDYSMSVDTSDGKAMDSMLTVETYDKKGNQISTIGYNKDGNITSKTTSTFNEYNKVVDYVVYDGYGDLQNKVHNNYDKKGLFTSSFSNDLKNKSIKITTVQMDGDIAKEIKETDNTSKLLTKYILLIHNDSLTTYEKYDSLNKPIGRIENKLFKKIIVGSKEIDLKTNTTNYEYVKKLNEMNLPIEQISYFNGEPSSLYKYVYYKF